MRNLKPEEVEFITFMLNSTENHKHLIGDLHSSKVIDMDDGGMGSLKFISSNSELQIFKAEIARYDYIDMDCTPVCFSLYLGTKDRLHELDSFKGDFSPLIQFPKPPFSILNLSI